MMSLERPDGNDRGEPVSVSYPRPDVALVSFERPATRNAQDFESLELLAALIGEISESDKVRALVLTGTGTVFCAGSDLRSSPKRGNGILSYSARLRRAQAVIAALYACPKLVVAAVNGAAIGVGLSLALAADLIVAAESAYFRAGFYPVAQIPDAGAAWFLVQTLGRHRATQILLTDQKVSANDGEQWGMVAKVTTAEALIPEAVSMAGRIAAGSHDALQLTKAVLRQVASEPLLNTFDGEAVALALNNRSPEKRTVAARLRREHGAPKS